MSGQRAILATLNEGGKLPGSQIEGEEKEPGGVAKTGQTKQIDCSKPGLNIFEVEGTPAFEFINKPSEGYVEVAIAWKVAAEGALPTFTGVTWINGEPAWNTTLGALNIAFFIVRKSTTGVIWGET